LLRASGAFGAGSVLRLPGRRRRKLDPERRHFLLRWRIVARRSYDEVVLVTGFPTFRARKMVEYVLEREPKSLVYAIVKLGFARECEAALAALPKAWRERVVPFEGDAAAMDLGLSGSEYRRVASEL